MVSVIAPAICVTPFTEVVKPSAPSTPSIPFEPLFPVAPFKDNNQAASVPTKPLITASW